MTWMMRSLSPALLLLVTACSLFQTADPRECPRVSILREATKATFYRDGPGRDLIDVVLETRIDDVTSRCLYKEDRLTVEAQINILAALGPAASERAVEVPFFVAVTDGEQEILAKKEFASRIEFKGSQTRAGVFEQIDQIIVLKEGQSGIDFEVIFGLQLTEEQLRQNRARRR